MIHPGDTVRVKKTGEIGIVSLKIYRLNNHIRYGVKLRYGDWIRLSNYSGNEIEKVRRSKNGKLETYSKDKSSFN